MPLERGELSSPKRFDFVEPFAQGLETLAFESDRSRPCVFLVDGDLDEARRAENLQMPARGRTRQIERIGKLTRLARLDEELDHLAANWIRERSQAGVDAQAPGPLTRCMNHQ